MPPTREITNLPNAAQLDFDCPELVAAVDAYRSLATRRRDALQRLRSLEDERPSAVDGDRQRYARALRAGKPDPGAKATDKIDSELAECRRLIDALGEALADARAELGKTVEEGRGRWRAALRQRWDAETEAILDAVDRLERAASRRSETTALQRWLDAFERRPDLRVSAPPVPLRGQNSDPYRLPEVLAALRGYARPPVTEPAGRHVPPAEQRWPALGPVGVLPGHLSGAA